MYFRLDYINTANSENTRVNVCIYCINKIVLPTFTEDWQFNIRFASRKLLFFLEVMPQPVMQQWLSVYIPVVDCFRSDGATDISYQPIYTSLKTLVAKTFKTNGAAQFSKTLAWNK